MSYVWSGLLESVRTGQPAHGAVFGRPFWEDLDAHPDVAASFDELMGPAGHGVPDPEICLMATGAAYARWSTSAAARAPFLPLCCALIRPCVACW